MNNLDIFLGHAGEDQIAGAIVRLLRNSFPERPLSIRCTSTTLDILRLTQVEWRKLAMRHSIHELKVVRQRVAQYISGHTQALSSIT